MEIRIEKEGRAQKQKYTPVLAPSRGLRQELKAAEKKVIKQSKPAAEGPEKAKGSPALTRTAVRDQPAPRPARGGDKSIPLTKSVPKKDRGKLKKFIAPRTALLIILLATLVGILSAYLGIVDIPLLQDYLKFGNEQVVTKVSSPGTQSVVPSERATSSPKERQEEEQRPSKYDR